MTEKWTTIISPHKKIFSLNVKELIHYRDLIYLFVKRDFTAQYKQTILGPLWFFLQPLLTTFVFTIIFGKVAKLPSDGVPRVLFYLNGVILWNYFSACVEKSSSTFIANANIFKKVYFPRLTIPISQVITNLFQLGIQFSLFLAVYIYYYTTGAPVQLSLFIFSIPFLVIYMAVLGFSIGIIVSSLTTRYRDLAFLVKFGLQLWMYATPIVYPLSMVPEKWRIIYFFNPLVPVFQAFKHAFFAHGQVDFTALGIGSAVTIFLFCSSIVVFNMVEKSFVDTV